MIRLRIGDCEVDILPVVNGLVSEAEKVRAAYGKYEAYAISLGIEGIEAVRHRAEISDDGYEVSELDIVYSKRMSIFGEVEIPSPAFCELVDLCTADGKTVIPLDFTDEEFDEEYIRCVSAFQFTNQHRLAKKGMKVRLPEDSPESMAKAWGEFVASHNKGLRKLDMARERHIADEIADIAKYRKSLLALIECERAYAVAEAVRNGRE